MDSKKNKLGLIQSRGIGDIIIALPIAKHYADMGYDIYWPICEQFVKNFQDHAPWVKWIPIPNDAQGAFFYEEPMKRLKNFKCDEIICLYQALTTKPEFSQAPWFQLQHFDEYKYTRAEVPFLQKWQLNSCVTRNLEREKALKDRLVKPNQPYYVTHLEGSDFAAKPDLTHLPSEWQMINITAGVTDSVFDWCTLLEGAEALICVDSCIACMADQLQLNIEHKYWIPRSHIHLTPVLGMTWTILAAPEDSRAAHKIFATG
jgi:hypothetical protein